MFCLLGVAVALPPIGNTVPSDGLGFAEAPDVGSVVVALQSSPRRAWLWALGDEWTASATGAGVGALDVWGKSPSTVLVRWGVQSKDGKIPTLERRTAWWKARGFVPEPPRQEQGLHLRPGHLDDRRFVLWQGDGAYGWGNHEQAATAVLTTVPSPRITSADYTQLVAATPSAWLRGRIDVQRVYGLLAASNDATVAAAIIDRLGLMSLRSGTFHVAPLGNDVTAIARFDLPAQTHGLIGSLSPSPGAVKVTSWSTDLLAVARAEVRPAALYMVAAKILNYLRPLIYTLFSAQVASWEDANKKSLDADLLGTAPRPWTVSAWRDGLVLEMRFAQSAQLWTLVKTLAASAKGSASAGRWQPLGQGMGSALVMRRGLTLAHEGEAVWLATSPEVLRNAISRPVQVVLEGPPSTFSMHVDEGAWVSRWQSRRPPAGLGTTTLVGVQEAKDLVVTARSSLK